MQTSFLEAIIDRDLVGKRVAIGLSGGINSAAVLVYLSQMQDKPRDIYLFHTNLSEHSGDTLPFVNSCVAYASGHFDRVVYEQDDQSIFKFFKGKNMIPHPMFSPCTHILKVAPMMEFRAKHKIDVDLVGYVREERNRINRQIKAANGQRKEYLIAHLSNEDCFTLVRSAIGWIPAIYDLLWTDERIKVWLSSQVLRSDDAIKIIRKYSGQGYGHRYEKRVFLHNNCLPCKNFQAWQYDIMSVFYPDRLKEANDLAERMGQRWGRGKGDECAVCTFD